jgi:hypothetical protein
MKGAFMQAIRSKSKSSLFLLELLIIIAFFAVASAVCIRLFARAHVVSVDSRDLNRAVIVAQSAAETFKAACGDQQAMARILGGVIGPGEEILLYYDSGWHPVPEQHENGYAMRVHTRLEGYLMVADIGVFKAGGGEVFSLEAARHLPYN